MNEDSLYSWFTEVVKGVLAHPEDLAIEKKTDEAGILYTVSVHQDDRRFIVGKDGSVAMALRVLLRVAARDIGNRVAMKLDIPQKTVQQ